MTAITKQRQIARVVDETISDVVDELAVEAPLAIVVDGAAPAYTMRTPGYDLDLATGWLVVEHGIRALSEIVRIDIHEATPDAAVGEGSGPQESERLPVDTVLVELASRPGPAGERQPEPSLLPRIPATLLRELPGRLREQQRGFDLAGATHAAGLATPSGELVAIREDVGRHNAVDKILGHALRNGIGPLGGHLLVLSGRVACELVQKAVAAGVGGIVAVSAPTTMAVDLARERGLLLAGFVRGTKMNVYSRPDLVC